ncbi:hypothetical protein [Marinomonas ostreistagni]|uniref:hypothetical protein n=1 Tax=Marinomonas ostreistagni TaxID=359209 RepID=UPI00195102CA|nr:hypothetical protein [Marinomonas ostreistagni]MBM6550748.1 hypothetical protein [Marinomonas ostreistagni]
MLIRNLTLVALPLLLSACSAVSNPEPVSEPQGEVTTAKQHSSQAQASSKDETPLLAEAKQAQQQAKQDNAQMERETQSREARYEHNLKQPKPLGASVCTWQNSVGTVGAIEDDRIKIDVKGRAPSATHGIFFSAQSQQQDIDRQAGSVWTDGEDWAVCDYQLK